MDTTIQEYKNFLSIYELDIINRTALEPRWVCNHGSMSRDNSSLFWRLDLNPEQDPFFFNEVFNKIKERTGENFEIERIYFNGHNACSGGQIHQDNTSPNARTFLIYCNQAWSPELGGGTVFVLDHDNIVTQYPYPRAAICFPGYLRHSALPTGKTFNGLRVTLAYKLLKI